MNLPITLVVVILVAFLFFLVLSIYTPLLSKIIFPRFGYKKYSEYLPFDAALGDNRTIKLKNGTLVRAWKMAGVQVSIQDAAAKEKFLSLRTQLLNSIADAGTSLRFFTIRDKNSDKTNYDFDQPVLQQIYNKWNDQGLRIFSNNYYLVLSTAEENLLLQHTNYVESVLSAYGPVALAHNKPDNIARLFGRILSPASKPRILGVSADMGGLATADDLEFLRGGVVRFNNGQAQKFAAFASFKVSPDYLDEEFFIEAAGLQCEMLLLNAMQPLGVIDVERTIRQHSSTIDVSGQVAEVVEEQIAETKLSMDENVSETQGMVNYYPVFVLFAETIEELAQHVAAFRKICAAFGISPAIEDFAAKVSFFALLPGFDVFPRSFKLLSRTAAVSVPMASVPAGVKDSDWGPGPIVVFPTAQGTAYQFQFHVSASAGAVGHTLTIGPTGGGKTTLFSFLIAQSLRHPRLKAFFFDRNRGAEIFTLSTGGNYLTLRGKSQDAEFNSRFETQLNPLKMEDSVDNRAFLRRWLQLISGQNDPRSLDEIARAVSVNFDYIDDKNRKLKNLWTSCFSSDNAMRPALKKWVEDEQYGNIFNEDKDTLNLFSRLTTFDFTDILNDETLAPAVIYYILHRINSLTIPRGDPSLIMIDETAPMLANSMFRENFVTGLQEGRKNRQAYMTAFQRANVLDRLGIGDVVRGQAQTIMFFRNPSADASDYEHWRLNPLEMAFIQGKAYPSLKRAVLLSRPVSGESVILNTELSGLGALLRLFESGRKFVLLAEELYKTFGNNFVEEYLKKAA